MLQPTPYRHAAAGSTGLTIVFSAFDISLVLVRAV